MSTPGTNTPVAIITGAGSGIGRATALRCGRERWRLLLVGRDESRLRETDAFLALGDAQPEATELLSADITDAGQCRGVIDATLAAFGRVDVLINNAGAVASAGIGDTDEALLHGLFAVNAFAPALLMAAAWPHFVRRRGGRIVNVSSMAALDPFPGLFAYAGSKAALDGFTRAVANEGREHGIEAYAVNPGAVETRMLRSVFDTGVVPVEAALDPAAVAEIVFECAVGARPFDNGRSIPVLRR